MDLTDIFGGYRVYLLFVRMLHKTQKVIVLMSNSIITESRLKFDVRMSRPGAVQDIIGIIDNHDNFRFTNFAEVFKSLGNRSTEK